MGPGPIVKWHYGAFAPARHGPWAYSIVVIRRIRIAETAVRFCLGPEALAGGLRRRESDSPWVHLNYRDIAEIKKKILKHPLKQRMF